MVHWKKTLTGVERGIVAVLKKHGPVMDRGAMEELCVRGGMNRFSFHAFVSWSPVIEQFGHSVYGLLGTKVSKETINDVVARRREQRRRLLLDRDHELPGPAHRPLLRPKTLRPGNQNGGRIKEGIREQSS